MGNILNNICTDEESKYIKINNLQNNYTPDRYKPRRKNSYFKSYIDFNNTKIKTLENSSLLNWRRNRPFQYMNEVNKSFSMSHSPIKQFNRLNFKANLNKNSNTKEKTIGDINENVSDMNKTIKEDIDINNNHILEHDQNNKKGNEEQNIKEFIPFEIIDMNNLNFISRLITPIDNKYLCKNEISLELLSSYDNKIYNHYLRLGKEYNFNNSKKYQYNINHINELENEFEEDVNICDFDKHKEKVNADKIFFNTFDYNNEEINNKDKAFYDYNVNVINKVKEYTLIQNDNQKSNSQNGQIFDNVNLSYISSKSKKKNEVIRNDFYIQRYDYEGYDISNNFKKSKLERNKVSKIKLAKSLYLEQSNKYTKRHNFNDRNRNTKLNECIQYTCSSGFKDKIEDLIDTPFKRKEKLEIKLLNVHVNKKDNKKRNNQTESNISNIEELDRLKINENINNEIDFNEIYPSVSQIKQKIGEVNNKIESLNLSKLKMKKIKKKQKRFEEYSKTENQIEKNRKEIVYFESILKKKEILDDTNFILELSNLRLSRIVFPIAHSETRIKKNFLLNDKEICISFNRIINSYIEYKDKRVNSDNIIIFDGQIEKISYLKTGFKSVERYFQVTTNEFKYFNSVFSSSVWNNKPLFSISLRNIVSISFSSKNESYISKDINSNKLLKVVFDMEVLIDESFIEENLLEAFQLRPKEEIKSKEQDMKSKKNENLLKKVIYTFGSNDEDLGICLMNVIILAKDTRKFIDKYTK